MATNLERLEKICGNNFTVFQKQAIYQWAKDFEEAEKAELKRQYENKYKKDLGTAVDHFIIAIAFVLHFNEKLKLGKKRLFDVIKDIQATVDLFGTHEYTAKDYQKMLSEEGIEFKINWDR